MRYKHASEPVPQNEADRPLVVSLQEKTPIPEVPTARELKETSVRVILCARSKEATH
jgi:hypothetical protein